MAQKIDNVPREVKVLGLKGRRLPESPEQLDLLRVEYDGEPHDVARPLGLAHGVENLTHITCTSCIEQRSS